MSDPSEIESLERLNKMGAEFGIRQVECTCGNVIEVTEYSIPGYRDRGPMDFKCSKCGKVHTIRVDEFHEVTGGELV